MEHDRGRYVTVVECQAMHATTKRISLLIMTMLTAFIIGVTWSVGAGWQATNRAQAVKHDLDVHSAAQQNEDMHIAEDLREIKADLKEIKNRMAPKL